MTDDLIRKELDELIENVTTFDKIKTPKELSDNSHQWKWGSYRGLSPVSFMLPTA